ncbi:MAG: hypothetical protein K0R00_928 [Herbinix sp.]|nr:hypothetical protein [Herbinix sp.]
MSLTALVKAIRQQESRLRSKENELLFDIAEITDIETAEAAKDLYDSSKHAYGFEGYLYQLTKLKTVLLAGVPANTALECVDSCLDAETIIKHYKSFRKEDEKL